MRCALKEAVSSLRTSCRSFLFFGQAHGFEETHETFLQTDLLKLLVKKCSKGTGFSKTWLLRDLEVRGGRGSRRSHHRLQLQAQASPCG